MVMVQYVVSSVGMSRLLLRCKFLSRRLFICQINTCLHYSLKVRSTFKYSDLSVRLAAPGQLQTKPDVNDLQFGKIFTDHMLKIEYHESLGGWQKPQIVPFENLVLHPAAKVLHYAIELFEGMKAYRGIDGKIRLFRPELNMKRMNATAVRSSLPTFDGNEMVECIKQLVRIDEEWVPHSEASSLYIRPTFIGIEPALGVASSTSCLLYVISSPVGSYFDASSSAVTLLADPRFTRAWIGGCGDKKMGSNYGPTIYVQKEAAQKGCQQVLWLFGEEHYLTEVGTMNIFMVYRNSNGEKEIVTPPLDGLILPGITRLSILELCREWKSYKITERKMKMKEIIDLLQEERLLELFGAGTACVVCPVASILYNNEILRIPTMETEDAVFRRVHKALTEIQYGRVNHPWAVSV